jgi:hypothetical protein
MFCETPDIQDGLISGLWNDCFSSYIGTYVDAFNVANGTRDRSNALLSGITSHVYVIQLPTELCECDEYYECQLDMSIVSVPALLVWGYRNREGFELTYLILSGKGLRGTVWVTDATMQLRRAFHNGWTYQIADNWLNYLWYVQENLVEQYAWFVVETGGIQRTWSSHRRLADRKRNTDV